MCATYINGICVLQTKVLFVQTKKAAGVIVYTACERCLYQNGQLTKFITNVYTMPSTNTTRYRIFAISELLAVFIKSKSTHNDPIDNYSRHTEI